MSRFSFSILAASLFLVSGAYATDLKGKPAADGTYSLFKEMTGKMIASGYVQEASVLNWFISQSRQDGQTRDAEMDKRNSRSQFGTTGKITNYESHGASLSTSSVLQVTRVGDRRSQRYTAQVKLGGSNLTLTMNRHKLKVNGVIPGRVLGKGYSKSLSYERDYSRRRTRVKNRSPYSGRAASAP